jgi:hypothetical protein
VEQYTLLVLWFMLINLSILSYIIACFADCFLICSGKICPPDQLMESKLKCVFEVDTDTLQVV